MVVPLAAAMCLAAGIASSTMARPSTARIDSEDSTAQQADIQPRVYLPVVFNQRTVRRVNAPYFNVADIGASRFAETAIFWFGRVSATDNYADVRVGYNNTELYIHLTIFDRRLWYDTSPAAGDLTAWDSATLLIDVAGATGSAPTTSTYRFAAQLNDWEPSRSAWQAAYRGDGSGWTSAGVAFSTETGYRWESDTDGGTNNNENNRGWVLVYHIPFGSLGLAGPPASGTDWGLAIRLHDRDDAGGTPIADKTWPETIATNSPYTWGQLVFGLPTYTPPAAATRSATTIRQGQNGAAVADAAVGGTTGNLCPGDSDYTWNVWGNANFAGATDFNIQNQSDVADWPCFAKYYVTFPLAAIPPGKVIISAALTLHQFGGSGGPGQAQPSLIQVLSIADGWSESTLTWNNAPLPLENIGRAWVNPMSGPLVWPGVPWTWDVSRAVAQAYAGGDGQLRLALYSADSAYHSGKYFTSSDTGDWNADGRPTLVVTWGDP